jgi:hypothetical protein
MLRQAASQQTLAHVHTLDVLERTITLLSVKDPISYQQIQAMHSAPGYDVLYDPSDEAEADRIHARDGERGDVEGDLNERERAFLGDVFPGLDL